LPKGSKIDKENVSDFPKQLLFYFHVYFEGSPPAEES
jgi:hypothetical protein